MYFKLAGVIGDNLAIHTILGFIKSFSANYPCRFCQIYSKDINSTFTENSFLVRTPQSYNDNILENKQSSMGIAGPSVLSK